MAYGVIDIGSNTVRLSVYKYDEKLCKIKLVTNKKIILGLTSYIKKGELSAIGINKVCRALKKLKLILERFELDNYYVFATASLRNISNSEDVLKEIEKTTNIKPEIILGEEEARLDFIGANLELKLEKGILIDIGGGSTEIVIFNDGKIEKLESISIGALNLQNKFVKSIVPNEKEIKNMRKYIREALEKLNWEMEMDYKYLFAIGGTVRACMNVIRETKSLPLDDGAFFVEDLYEIMDILKKEGPCKEKKELYRIIPERIFSFAGGVAILREIIDKFRIEKVIVSKNGVREGYFIDRVINRNKEGDRN
ncbi:rod shape-determining protein [Fusobacterium sp.]|uniref:Ppx/GppA phosphatase family protein n=1 Tax=Fusobacterium sp. TaxID=68766 RepID=UPI0025BF4E9E|nr:rod shape-determining protein [Fusobacterium sp.]